MTAATDSTPERGRAIPLVGGPWDGQEVWVPTQPTTPHDIRFPIRWHDGTWDNAHWEWLYTHRNTSTKGEHYECQGQVAAPGLTPRDIAEQAEKHGPMEASDD